MGLEWEGEVTIAEDFSTWDRETRLELIAKIAEGETVEFTGETSIDIDPPDRN